MSKLQQLLDKKYPFGPEMSHTDEEIRKWQRHDFSAGWNAAIESIIGFSKTKEGKEATSFFDLLKQFLKQ